MNHRTPRLSPPRLSIIGSLHRWAAVLFVAHLLFSSPVAADMQQAMQQAREQLKQGQTASAISALKNLRKQYPAAPEPPLLLGIALARNGEFEQSDKVFNALIQAHPDLVQAYNNLAASQAAQGHLEDARKTLIIAIKRAPKYPVAHENLADIYTHLAESAYATAARLQAQNPRLQQKLTAIRQFIRSPTSQSSIASKQAQTAPSPPNRCSRIGPFIKSRHLASFKKQLEQAKITYKEQIHAGEEVTYSVYMPAIEGSTAQQRIKQLANQGIRDIAAINKGQHKGGVAMGVYRNPRSVQRRLRSLRARGLDPQSETLTKLRQRPWLHLPAHNSLTQKQVTTLKKLHKKNLSSLPASCP